MISGFGRRAFLTALGGAAASWRFAARAQPTATPVVAVVGGGSAAGFARELAAFRKGLRENGYVEDNNVTVEYHWLEGKYDRLPALMADIVRRQVAVIATSGSGPAALGAKAATATIPVVFGFGEDPVRLGLVASLAHPGGNATGINFFANEVVAKRLRLFHDMLPKGARVAVLLNPANTAATKSTLDGVKTSAEAIGMPIRILNASTAGEIDAAFADLTQDHLDALFVAPDAFFTSQALQFASLTVRDKIPASFAVRELAAAGGLMSYGTDLADMNYQVALYVARILKGENPSQLPVLQSTKFEFILNLKAAKAFGLEVPPGILSIADEVIE